MFNSGEVSLQSAQLVSERKVASILNLPVEVIRGVANRADDFYQPFDQTQNRNGRVKTRHIDNPTGLLKAIQARINKCLLRGIDFPEEIMGGVRKRSAVNNAEYHIRQPEIAKLDIEQYFESVRLDQVADAWRRQFKTGRDVTWLLTRLTTYGGHLPTGAPTSTALANIVFLPIAAELRALCAERRLRFTVYVDDLTLSGHRARDAIEGVIRLLAHHGFRACRRKTEVMTRGFSQTVTGSVVNRKVSNGRDRVREIRRQILALTGVVTTDEAARLAGRVAHASAVCASQGRGLRALLKKVHRPHISPKIAPSIEAG